MAKLLNVSGVRGVVSREWGSVLTRIAEIDGATWTHPTRCTGWTVGDLAAHGAWGVAVEADGLHRARGGHSGPPQADRPVAEDGRAAVHDALAAALEALIRETDALRPTDLQRTAPTLVGEIPLALALQMFATEAAVHSSDLAAALGADDTLEADAVTAVTATLAAFLPALAEAGVTPPSDGTVVALAGRAVDLRVATHDGRWVLDNATEPTTWVRGDDSDVLLFALGRLAAVDPRLAVDGDIAVAERFKDYIPGP